MHVIEDFQHIFVNDIDDFSFHIFSSHACHVISLVFILYITISIGSLNMKISNSKDSVNISLFIVSNKEITITFWYVEVIFCNCLNTIFRYSSYSPDYSYPTVCTFTFCFFSCLLCLYLLLRMRFQAWLLRHTLLFIFKEISN